MAGRRTVDDLLAEARARIDRLTPEQAHRVVAEGALLVDIRPLEIRRSQGNIPGARVVARTVLEWRLDPSSDARDPEVTGLERPIVVICAEGYSSSLAAAVLKELGHHDVADVVGGAVAWKEAGLPLV